LPCLVEARDHAAEVAVAVAVRVGEGRHEELIDHRVLPPQPCLRHVGSAPEDARSGASNSHATRRRCAATIAVRRHEGRYCGPGRGQATRNGPYGEPVTTEP